MPTPGSNWVRDVEEATFEADVLAPSDSVPVIVDFWSPSCAPCRTLGPILERLTNERKGKVLLAKINTDDNPRLASYFDISAIPAIKVIYQRQLVHEFEGLQPEPALRAFFDEICGGAGDAEPEAAPEELGDPVAAEKTHREALAREPERQDARIGLARALLKQGKFSEIAEILEPVGSSGDPGAQSDQLLGQLWLKQAAQGLPEEKALQQQDDAESRLQLGIHLGAREAYEEALASLYAAAERDLKLASGKAREAMVKVFYALGTNHPLANEYRSKLARLLY